MTVKEVIEECLAKLGSVNFIDNEVKTAAQTELLNRLLSALNIVYRGAVQEYLPSFAQEEVVFAEGVLDEFTLSNKILYPVWVKSGGIKQSIRGITEVRSDFSGKAVLKYAYMPDKLTLTDDIPDTRLSSSILSNGTLAEYYFQNKVFDIAKSYDTDFRSALSVLRYKGRELRYFTSRG